MTESQFGDYSVLDGPLTADMVRERLALIAELCEPEAPYDPIITELAMLTERLTLDSETSGV